MYVTEDDADQAAIGAAVETLRVRAGLSKAETARRAGISAKTLDRVVAGEPVAAETIAALAPVLGVSLDDLLAVGRGAPIPPDFSARLDSLELLMVEILDRMASIEAVLGDDPQGPRDG